MEKGKVWTCQEKETHTSEYREQRHRHVQVYLLRFFVVCRLNIVKCRQYTDW